VKEIEVTKQLWIPMAATQSQISTLKGRDHSVDLGVDAKVMLEWILGI